MTSPSGSVRPPHLASWLVNLFAASEEAEAVLGDMFEEFSQLASRSSIARARTWYWRETRKTVASLAVHAFLGAPWLTVAAVIGGLLLNRLVSGPSERAIFGFFLRHRVYYHVDSHSFAYVFWPAIAHVIASLFSGCVTAWFARRREMVTTIALAAVLGAMTGIAMAVLAANGKTLVLWMLPWYMADWLAIAIGGAIVRMLRPGAAHRPSAT